MRWSEKSHPKVSDKFCLQRMLTECLTFSGAGRRELCNNVKTRTEFRYFGNRVSAGGRCVTALTRCGWVKFKECGQLLYGKMIFSSC